MRSTRNLKSLVTLACCHLFIFYGPIDSQAKSEKADEKYRILVVDSYHGEYLWSQETGKGFASALLEQGFLDSKTQLEAFLKSDQVESQKATIKRVWMDTKRNSQPPQISSATKKVIDVIDAFKPQLVFLGDDNAANFIGNHYIDQGFPMVFWGVNGTPLKYNLLDSEEKPGHNITGVYQAGYFKESLAMLLELYPEAKNFAIIADDTATGRSKAKTIEALAKRGELPLSLNKTILTNDFDTWKSEIKAAEPEVDAFFVLNYQGLKDKNGQPLPTMEAPAWYLKNINKPEVSDEKQFVETGMLLSVDDSGYNQGYVATKMGLEFLLGRKSPATTAPLAPAPGPRVLNANRANQLKTPIAKTKVDEKITYSLGLGQRKPASGGR
ncbi:MAG: hypothetical protein H6624_07375 [Bdellovibrionaceae bacterium]|nr:hypothetical protein [Bdellovibrionales bacterium]MCB9084149.1 hypothetical protein [Pseudobdellovibrionaceae bacterium]